VETFSNFSLLHGHCTLLPFPLALMPLCIPALCSIQPLIKLHVESRTRLCRVLPRIKSFWGKLSAWSGHVGVLSTSTGHAPEKIYNCNSIVLVLHPCLHLIAKRLSARHWIAECGQRWQQVLYVYMYVRHAFGMQLNFLCDVIATNFGKPFARL